MNRFYSISLALLLAPITAIHAMESLEEAKKKIENLEATINQMNLEDPSSETFNMEKKIIPMLEEFPKLIKNYNTILEQLNPEKHTVSQEQLNQFTSDIQSIDNQLKTTFASYKRILSDKNYCSSSNLESCKTDKNKLSEYSTALYEKYFVQLPHLAQIYSKHPAVSELLNYARECEYYIREKRSVAEGLEIDFDTMPLASINALGCMLESAQK